VAQALLAEVDPSPGVRLLGVSASNLVEGPATQLSLADAEEGHRVAQAVEDVRRRYGEAAVGPATLLATGAGEPSGLRLRRMGDQQWGPGKERLEETGR
jgi:DNA polymerase-4